MTHGVGGLRWDADPAVNRVPLAVGFDSHPTPLLARVRRWLTDTLTIALVIVGILALAIEAIAVVLS